HFPIGTFVFFPPSNVATNFVDGTLTVTTQALGSTVLVMTNPVGYVQTTAPDAALHSRFDPGTSVQFGVRSPFTFLQVMEPQVGARLLILDPDSNNYAYINAADVGPSGPPPGRPVSAGPGVAGTTQPQGTSAVVRGLLANLDSSAVSVPSPAPVIPPP